jgi:hypothetical protein
MGLTMTRSLNPKFLSYCSMNLRGTSLTALMGLAFFAASAAGADGSHGYSPKLFPRTLDVASLPSHPRLVVKDAQLPLIKTAIAQRAELTKAYASLEANAEKLLVAPMIQLKGDGEGGLAQARHSMRLIVTLAGMYRLDGDARKLARVRKELLAAAAIEVWDSDNFLLTAELSFGVSIGYDWIFNSLTPGERKTISRALIEKSLVPGQRRFIEHFKWVDIATNWNPVCNGGLAVTALAVAEAVPTLSAEILDRAVDSIKISMAKYAPDGGDPEGPMYWDLGTTYNIHLIDGLLTTFGHDWGLKASPGFSATARYGMAMIDPLGLRANTSDAETGAGPITQMFWFAREYQEPAYFEWEAKRAAQHPWIFHLLRASTQPEQPPAIIPTNQLFQAIDVAVFRDNWNDPRASYVAFKGGSNLANHAHLDLGSFILVAKGERWSIDLGPDNDELPGYNGRDARRWTYFRVGTRSHNTLILDSENQNLRAEAKITRFRSEGDTAFAIMDLSSAYPEKTASMQRGLRKAGSNFLIQDELELKTSTDVTWNFATKARIQLSEKAAELVQGHEHIGLRILEPAGAEFEIVSAERPPPENENRGVRLLQIKLPQVLGKVRIVVAVESTPFQSTDLKVTPLVNW